VILLLDTFIVLTPFAWGTACWFALKAIALDRKNWRNKVSVTALGITTLAGLLSLPAGFYSAHSPGTGKFRTIDEWTAVAVVMCGLALVLSLLGRPKLIIPIALACMGTASFWIGTTIP
jgi:hypothetical protein